MRIGLLAAAVAGLGLVSAASAQTVIVADDFESYSTSAELQAAWPGSGGQAVLDTTLGNPGQSAQHWGGAVAEKTFTQINPTAADPIILTAQIYDDQNSNNERLTVGLRSNSPANLIELGHYNGTLGSLYHYRLVLFDDGGPNWVPFDAAPTEGWHTYQAIITDTGVTLTLDIGSDGIIDDTQVVAVTAHANGFDSLRFGGPSSLSSGSVPFNVDNISLVQGVIPEPGTMALAGIAGLGLLRRRR